MARKRSKRYREAAKRMPPRGSRVATAEAVKLLQSIPHAKFDETVEVALKLGIDPRKADQIIRGSFAMPNGLGKTKRVIAFVEGEQAQEARDAGAIEVGTEDLAKKIQDGWLDFDVAIAHPAAMRFVGRLGRILGPQGKMPSPKSGTVTENVALAVREFAGGKIEFRNDAGGNVHAPVGKISFEVDKLVENIEAFVEHILSLRPPTAKGTYLQKVAVSSTMSPGIELAVGS
ncbi:MAG: 50S ribosomal protein L1 [Planctomycetota bacterium]|nr:MAG: 50S ribosomal protein L1 [Planctomycetota bacterium]